MDFFQQLGRRIATTTAETRLSVVIQRSNADMCSSFVLYGSVLFIVDLMISNDLLMFSIIQHNYVLQISRQTSNIITD